MKFITVKFHIRMYVGSDISYKTRVETNDTALSIQMIGLSSLITRFFR